MGVKTIDGLENPELLDHIVGELMEEFPDISREEIANLVRERRARLSRPATGGILFLESQKFLLLQQDEVLSRH